MSDINQGLKTLNVMLKIALLLLVTIVVILVLVLRVDKHKEDDKLSELTIFQRTIVDASGPNQRQEVDTLLFALNSSNKALHRKTINEHAHVKAVFWLSNETFCKYYDQGVATGSKCAFDPKPTFIAPPENEALVWLTLVPQVQQFCQALGFDNPTFRLKQFLGLNPNRYYQRFVEVWVKPEDLFRPCPDPQTNDTSCDLVLDPNKSVKVKGIDNYTVFFQKLKQDTYALSNGAPWTRLGYTYDWIRGTRNVGASEYIASPGSTLTIESSYTTAEYCL